MTSFLDIAKPLIERGFSVIPIEPRGKAPVKGWGSLYRTRDIQALQDPRLEEANVAICADENFVILESDNFPQFKQTVLNGTGKEIPETLMACGSSEDRPHLFFRRTEMAGNVGNLVVPGLFEARFTNQYVVGPGSIHPSGAVYRWLNDVPVLPIPDWLVSELARLALDQKASKQRTAVLRDGSGCVPEGGRHYFRFSALGAAWDGVKTEEEMIALAVKLNEMCVPPDPYEDLVAEVRDIMEREPNKPVPKVILDGKEIKKKEPHAYGPVGEVNRKKGKNIVPSLDKKGNRGGWFPRGAVSLAAGASGMGKTTLLCRIAEDLRVGKGVMLHPPSYAEYGFLLVDRTIEDMVDSVEGLEGAQEILDRCIEVDLLDNVEPSEHLDNALKKWESEYRRMPDVVFLEGADLWCGESSDVRTTVRFIKSLINVAKAWNIAIVASVGSPKQKPKEEYALTRDKVFGSVAWGRTCNTIIHIGLTDSEDPDSCRRVMVLTRTARSEKFYFYWDDKGNFIVSEKKPGGDDKPAEPKGVAETRKAKVDDQAVMITVIESKPLGTQLNIKKDFPWMDKSKATRFLQQLARPETGWVGKDDEGKWIVLKSKGETN